MVDSVLFNVCNFLFIGVEIVKLNIVSISNLEKVVIFNIWIKIRIGRKDFF